MSAEPPAPDDEPVPKIPYGRGLKLDGQMLFRIGATLALLILIVVAARPCANATSKFVTDFDEKGSASETMPKPGNVDKLEPEYEKMGGTPEEDRAAYERAMAKVRRDGGGSAGSGSAGSGSAATGSSGSGSANNGTSNGSAASGSEGSGAASTSGSGAASTSGGAASGAASASGSSAAR